MSQSSSRSFQFWWRKKIPFTWQLVWKTLTARTPKLVYLSLHAPAPSLPLSHTTVSELDPFPVKKSQKLAADDGLPSSCCFTQMLFSVEPLRLEQLPALPPLPLPRVKLMAAPRAPRRSPSWLCTLDKLEGWDKLSRLWWEWNWRMWRMDFAERVSPAESNTWTGLKATL